jgi:DNA-binding IclR family transcriptional regulator
VERESSEPGPSVTERVFLVLEHCAAANRSLSLAELAIRTGMAKSTLHRVCWKLVELGGLEAGSNGFRIGTRLFALGGLNPAVRQLRAMSMPVLYDLCSRSGWMANLAVRSGDRALLVEEICCDQRVTAQMIGARLPLHATANGKALIAHLSQPEIEALVARNGLRAFTRHTIVRADVLVEHLAKARAAGVTTASEEWHQGAAGVAAPIVVDGVTVAAISLVGVPDARLLRQMAQPVLRAAQLLACSLSRTTATLRPAA